MGWESFDVSDLTLNPSFKVKRGQPNLKVLITRLLLILEVCNMKPNLQDIVGWESSDVRFDLWPLLQGQTMVHWLWLVIFPVDTDLHRFSDA